MKNVLHLIRKNSHLKASFIKNQISHHILYQPFIVYRFFRSQTYDRSFADFDEDLYQCLNLAQDESIGERSIFKVLKMISNRQAERIEEYARENNVDVLHFHYGSDAGIFYPLLKRTSLPSIVSFYGYDCSSFPKLYWNFGKHFLKRRIFPHVNKVIAMSEDMKNDLERLGCPAGKIIVHYHGIDVQLFKSIQKYNDISDKTCLLILSGLVPQKGHFFLLHALKSLIEKGRLNFELRIVGSGPLESKLQKFVQQNDLCSRVFFIGAVKYGSEAMFTEYRNADLFVHPSITDVNGDKEGIPGAIVEAMTAGLPIISTFHAGIPYVIENEKTGLLVNEWDVPALANAIERLMQDVELRKRLGEAAKKYAVEYLDLHKKEVELEAIYSSLLVN